MMARPLASLRSRVFAATAAVAVVATILALVLVTRRVTQEAEAELSRRLAEAARLVEQYHRTRLELAAERASLVADLPKLKAAVAEADPRTAEPIARDYRDRVRSDVLVLADRGGRTLVSLGADAATWRGDPAPFREERGRLLETVGAPILLDHGGDAPELLGHLTLGFALDAAFAERLRALTGAHVAVAEDGHVFASTLARRLDAALLAAAGEGTSELELAGESYVALRVPLGPGAGSPVVVVLRSRAEALRPLHALRAALFVAALAAVGLGVLLSWALARTVTRPLAALTDAMREIATTGDLARRIGPGRPWDDEDARLVARTFDVLTDSIARFQREAALRERLSALGRLSTVIAHEVRNPLMIIKGSLRSLRQEGALAEGAREAAADIDHQVVRLDRIVGDVLDFARPLRVEPAPVDVAALAEDAARAAFEGPEGPWPRLALDPAPGSIVTDGERLRGVLVNLLENARDSVLTAGRAGPDAVEIGARRLDPARVLLWVEDRGAGVAAADLPHVFEPYYTTKRTGTGLGLAIARKVVEALGGSIRMESREGEGTRVEIELPAAGPADEEAR
jgi:signal transduction histidine kinase